MLYVESINKEVGIRKIAKELGHKNDTIVVFGSGANDVSALKQPWLSIAPRNGVNDALIACDYVTDSSGLNGILYACQFFGWLPQTQYSLTPRQAKGIAERS
jgi:hydroxymethylpyrimidine pyrophosphatase-like HAD family hydrolase